MEIQLYTYKYIVQQQQKYYISSIKVNDPLLKVFEKKKEKYI